MASSDPADIWTYYQRVLDALDIVFALARNPVDVQVGTRANQLVGMTLEEARSVLAETRKELDLEVSLGLAAALEAIIIRDCEERLDRGGHDALTKRLRKLEQSDRVTHRDVLDAWKQVHASAGTQVGEFKQVVNFRDWLAHGRRWLPKGYAGFIPDTVLERARALQNAIRGFPVLVPSGVP